MKFPAGFFEKEIKCGFEIPEIMKRAWAAEMELLQAVIEVCEKHGLHYFADGGTLLGAVRHQGFIPWDDDIDICLKREEYTELIKILPSELPPGIAMAGMYANTERLRKASLHPYIRVVADDTYWDYNEWMKRFHGFPYLKLGIDIFPLDYLPKDRELEKTQKYFLAFGIYTLENWEMYVDNGELEERLSMMEGVFSTVIPRNEAGKNLLWKLMDAVSAMYGEHQADELVDYYYYIQNPELHVKKECYAETVYLPFEQIQIAAPAGYDEVLLVEYGNYMVYDRGNIGHTYPFYGYLEEELVKWIHTMGFTGTVEEFCKKMDSGELHINC